VPGVLLHGVVRMVMLGRWRLRRNTAAGRGGPDVGSKPTGLRRDLFSHIYFVVQFATSFANVWCFERTGGVLIIPKTLGESAPKRYFTYHKAKLLSLVPECLLKGIARSRVEIF
jgi:hypothetical protein